MRFLFFFILCTCLLSCNEEIKTNIILGQVIENCEGKKISNTKLILLQSDNQKIIGTAKSGAEGNFSISYEMEEDKKGSAELKFFNGESFEKILSSIPLNESLDLTIVKNNNSKLIVQIETNNTFDQDTLYYSISGINKKYKIIAPANSSSDTVQFQIPTNVENSLSKKFYWGLGETEYQKAKKSVDSRTPYHQISFVAKSCGSKTLTIEL